MTIVLISGETNTEGSEKFKMKMNDDMMKYGATALGMGAAAAMVVGVSKMNSPQRKIKKLAKKSAKTIDNIMGNMQYMFK